MDDQTRFKFMVIMTITMVLGFFAWSLQSYLMGEMFSSVGVLVLTIVIIALSFRTLRKVDKDLKKGLPIEDEMSRRIKQKAGYYALLVLMYVILALIWISELGIMEILGMDELSAYQALILVIVSLMVLFMGFWKYFSMKGKVS